MKIRAEGPGDEEAIALVLREAFKGEDVVELIAAMRTAGKLVLSLVAEMEGKIVGHVAFSLVTNEGGNGLGLAPLAVLPEHQRMGVGTALTEAGVAKCRELACSYLVVLGSPDYYGRFGFQTGSGYGLEDEFGGGEAFQAMELNPGALEAVAGLVAYEPEFARFT